MQEEDAYRNALRRRADETLTAGYAQALMLDGECLRIVRRITSLAAEGETPASSPELRALALRLGEAQLEVRDLRRSLEELKRRIDPSSHRY